MNRTYSDVAQTLSYNPNFSLRTDVYSMCRQSRFFGAEQPSQLISLAYENGQSSLLLNVAGTLPVSFRGTTYMFPISLWVPHEYPRAVPIAFVTPTRSMAVRPGQYVSGEGRIYHPYLAAWRQDVSRSKRSCRYLRWNSARSPNLAT